MKFLDKHPTAKPDQEVEPSLVRIDKEGACWHCKAPSLFVDMDFLAYFCSEECRKIKNEEYGSACKECKTHCDTCKWP